MSKDITIELTNSGKSISFPGRADETILSSALRQSVGLRYHCASGICETCRASLVTGTALLVNSDAGASVQVKEGEGPANVLLCQARPVTDCQIAVPYSLDGLSRDFDRPAYCDGTVIALQFLGGNLFDLSVELSKDMPFKPGQFALVSIGNSVVSRAYSMASYRPGESTHRYIIALAEHGKLSRILCANDIVGKTVSVFGPLGHCYPDANEFKDLVVIVGGSGLSVALAMLEWYRHFALDRNGVSLKIFWGVRALCDSPLLSTLDDAAAFLGESAITVCYDTCPHPEVKAGWSNLRFFEGNPANAATGDDALTLDEHTGVFISGSSAFVDHVTRMVLMETSVEPGNIRSDSFA